MPTVTPDDAATTSAAVTCAPSRSRPRVNTSWGKERTASTYGWPSAGEGFAVQPAPTIRVELLDLTAGDHGGFSCDVAIGDGVPGDERLDGDAGGRWARRSLTMPLRH